MGGILRITRAEFIKIFKKPSIYIMGFILAFTLVASLLFFNPENKNDTRINILGTTIGDMYDNFTKEVGSETKKEYDRITENAELQIKFYETLNTKYNNMEEARLKVMAQYDLLVSLKDNNALTEQQRQTEISSLRTRTEKLKEKYSDFLTLETNEYIINFKEQKLYKDTINSINVLLQAINNYSTNIKALVNQITVESIITNLNNYLAYDQDFVLKSFLILLNKLQVTQDAYAFGVINNINANPNERFENWTAVSQALKQLESHYLALLASQNLFVYIEGTVHKEINTLLSDYKAHLNRLTEAPQNESEFETHRIIVSRLTASNFKAIPKLKESFESFYGVKVQTSVLNNLNENLAKVNTYKTQLNTQIVSYKTNNETNREFSKKDKFNELVGRYKNISVVYSNMVSFSITINSLKDFPATKINEFHGYGGSEGDKQFNVYHANEEIAKVKYLIKHKKAEFDFSDVFSFNRNSYYETSAWDYMFFALKVSSLVIFVFAILMAANLIASEYDSGTIKLLAIRPFKRSKIITGKLLATMFFAITFVLFSALIAFFAGYFMYSLPLQPVLAVFNGTAAFSISPIALMFINIGCIILEVIFYAIIALSLSTIFRSFAGATSTSLIVLLLALALNILLGGMIWYSYMPFANLDFFRFLGGSFLTEQQTALNYLFASPVATTSSIIYSASIYGGTLAIILFFTYLIFKKRDF